MHVMMPTSSSVPPKARFDTTFWLDERVNLTVLPCPQLKACPGSVNVEESHGRKVRRCSPRLGGERLDDNALSNQPQRSFTLFEISIASWALCKGLALGPTALAPRPGGQGLKPPICRPSCNPSCLNPTKTVLKKATLKKNSLITFV